MRIRFAALDEMGHEIMVEADAHEEMALYVVGFTRPPTMAEYDLVRPPDPPIKSEALGTRDVPKENQIHPRN